MKILKSNCKEWLILLERIKKHENNYTLNLEYNGGRYNYTYIIRLTKDLYTFNESKYVYDTLKACKIAIAKMM
jgi:hypothetical protein